METTQEFIVIQQAKVRYRISPDTIRKKVAAGQLTFYSDGWDSRRRLLKVSELESLLNRKPRPVAGKGVGR